MIVEADEDLSIHVMKLLKKHQYETLELTNTEHLFSRVYHFRPDLFVLGHGQKHLLPALKAFDPTHHLPVICLDEGIVDDEMLLAAIHKALTEIPVPESLD